MHVSACIWMYIILEQQLWDNPAYVNNQLWQGKFSSDSEFQKYITCIYLSLLMIFGRNTGPLTDVSMIFASVCNMIGLFLLGYLLGLFSELIFETNEQALMAEQEADASVFAMK